MGKSIVISLTSIIAVLLIILLAWFLLVYQDSEATSETINTEATNELSEAEQAIDPEIEAKTGDDEPEVEGENENKAEKSVIVNSNLKIVNVE